MRIILAGGGTGGHLFPGLAVAREFQKRDVKTEILFVGSERGIESRVLPREGFPLVTLPVRGLKGRGLRGLCDALYGVPLSLLQSFKILRRFQPHCVIGLGGYASGPLLLAGKLAGIRCAIMEQNLYPGLTNRVLGRIVDRVFTAYAESAAYFPRGKAVTTGNPVRWRSVPEVAKAERFTLLVFGGSAGAHRINVCVVEALEQLKDLAPRLAVIHQTGETDFATIQQAYRALPVAAEVLPFIERMDQAYARADLVICRAGATTVAELTALGKAAILVPYPYAAYDHQRGNALALVNRGAAEMILDRSLSGAALAERIRTLATNPERLAAMARAAARLGRPDAAERIVEACCALAQK